MEINTAHLYMVRLCQQCTVMSQLRGSVGTVIIVLRESSRLDPFRHVCPEAHAHSCCPIYTNKVVVLVSAAQHHAYCSLVIMLLIILYDECDILKN